MKAALLGVVFVLAVASSAWADDDFQAERLCLKRDGVTFENGQFKVNDSSLQIRVGKHAGGKLMLQVSEQLPGDNSAQVSELEVLDYTRAFWRIHETYVAQGVKLVIGKYATNATYPAPKASVNLSIDGIRADGKIDLFCGEL
jgi:hypothetical protein